MEKSTKLQYLRRTLIGEPTISKNESSEYSLIVNMDDLFSDVATVSRLCDLLIAAKTGDRILVMLNSPGGNVHALNGILAAMAMSPATIITRATGIVASCGFFLWIQGDELEVAENALLMCHGSSNFGVGGNTKSINEYTSFMLDMVRELMQPAIDKGIMTVEECSQAIDKKCDLYFNHKDLTDRGVL